MKVIMEDKRTALRIKELMENEGLNASQLAKMIGFNQSNLSKILRGTRPVPANLIEALLTHTKVNREWLVNGEGGMYADKPTATTLYIPSNAVPSVEMTEIEYAGRNHNDGIFYRDKNTGRLFISVPHVPYAARGEFPNLADSLEPSTEWGREVYEVDRKAQGRYISFDVKGDSMDNGMRKSLVDGDKVLVRELELDNWRTLRAGDHRFWVLVFDSSVLIKEISTFDPVTGVITCHSLTPSPEYHDFEVQLDTVRHLYYVIDIKPATIKCL